MYWNSLSTRKWPEETMPSDSRSRRTSSTSSGSRPSATATSCALCGPSTSRRPYALDEAFVHELPRPLADVGEGGGGDLEDGAALLLQEVRVPDPVQVREEVLLPGDLRELAAEVLDDFARLELNRADLVRRHDALEDLAMEFPQEGGAGLPEDEIGDGLEDDGVGARGG